MASRETWNKSSHCPRCGNVGIVFFSDYPSPRIDDCDMRVESIPPAFKALPRQAGGFDIWCVKCDVPSLDLLRSFDSEVFHFMKRFRSAP